MTYTFDPFTVTYGESARVSAERTEEGGTRFVFRSDAPQSFTIRMSLPARDLQYQWHPACRFDRALRADWAGLPRSAIAYSAPVVCFFAAGGRNRLTISLDDAVTPLQMGGGIREEDGTLTLRCVVPAQALTEGEYALTVYLDDDDVPFYEALARVSRRWEQKYPPMNVPELAREPLYSFWYSFHQAVKQADVERECARAAENGFKCVIVDDGWQTDDGSRGYAYCGDWENAPSKIPDMRAHVKNVHAMGLKYMLWYSVPFIGNRSKHWETFRDRLLTFLPSMNAGVLDPRWPDVREYLIYTYERALTEWDLDGFKLDFIDSFSVKEPPQARDGMDIPGVEQAVLRLMTDIRARLTAIRPDILIEFRQNYIGPAMRTYGNMFRVSDCPCDPISNRVGAVDLRLMMGGSAVSSDMLMWHADDTDEAAARQLISCAFTAVQFSVKLDTLTPSKRALMRFWLDFFREQRGVLLDGRFMPEQPENLYPVVRAERDGRSVIAVYAGRQLIALDDGTREAYLLNASNDALLAVQSGTAFTARLFSCTGEPAGTQELPAGCCALRVPVGGMARLRF